MAENKHDEHAAKEAPLYLTRPELRHERTDADVWAQGIRHRPAAGVYRIAGCGVRAVSLF